MEGEYDAPSSHSYPPPPPPVKTPSVGAPVSPVEDGRAQGSIAASLRQAARTREQKRRMMDVCARAAGSKARDLIIALHTLKCISVCDKQRASQRLRV